MIILTLRTDKPEAEIGLFDDQNQLVYETWQAHRQLAETIHNKIKVMLDSQKLKLSQIEAIGVYQGPGSFTGLRIGLSVANTLANSLNLPIAGSTGDDWLSDVIKTLETGQGGKIVLPEYGAQVHITQPKK